eukprot:3418491-Pyramimonas_sp.AAC.1
MLSTRQYSTYTFGALSRDSRGRIYSSFSVPRLIPPHQARSFPQTPRRRTRWEEGASSYDDGEKGPWRVTAVFSGFKTREAAQM